MSVFLDRQGARPRRGALPKARRGVKMSGEKKKTKRDQNFAQKKLRMDAAERAGLGHPGSVATKRQHDKF